MFGGKHVGDDELKICPNTDCDNFNSIPRKLYPDEIQRYGDPIWASGALKCGYCGCVFTGPINGKKTIHGWDDAKWEPVIA